MEIVLLHLRAWDIRDNNVEKKKNIWDLGLPGMIQALRTNPKNDGI